MNIRTFNQCVKNCLWITGIVVSFHSTFHILNYFTQKPRKQPFQIDNRLYLFNNFLYSREDIIDLGRKALRDPNTSQILKNPIVKEDGLSYESESLSNTEYENRTLKESIDNYQKKNKKSMQ